MCISHPNRPSTRDLELVIARELGPCDWSDRYESRRTMYQKGPTFVTGAYQLPNVGREAHTYLTHIVNHYDDLAEYTVFLNHDIEQTSQDRIADFFNSKREVTVGRLKAMNLTVSWNVDAHGFLKDTGIPKNNRFNGPMKAATLPFGQWFNRVIASDGLRNLDFNQLSRMFVASQNGNFSVHRNFIQDKPKAYFESLLTWVSDHPNPEWAKYMSHAWLYIFMPVNDHPYRIGLVGENTGTIELTSKGCEIPDEILRHVDGNFRHAMSFC